MEKKNHHKHFSAIFAPPHAIRAGNALLNQRRLQAAPRPTRKGVHPPKLGPMFEPHGPSYEPAPRIHSPVVEPLLIRGEGDGGGDPLEGLSGPGGRERDARRGNEGEEVIGDGYELKSQHTVYGQDIRAPGRWMDGR